MGFTPLAGLMMGTRSGSVDPGILLYLLKERGLTADQIDDALNHASGLLGRLGRLGRLPRGRGGRRTAATTGPGWPWRSTPPGSARPSAALAATLGGLDALVFAAGVGENSATLRAAACEGLGFLGVRPRPGPERRPSPGRRHRRGRLARPGSWSSTPAKTS